MDGPGTILERLRRRAVEVASAGDHASALRVRGLWKTQYALRLNPDDTVLRLDYLLAQTVAQGCAYFDASRSPALPSEVLGQSALDCLDSSRELTIALLDAVYGSIPSLRGEPDRSFVLDGPNHQKARQRAEVVVGEVARLASARPPKRDGRHVVANVGVVGTILAALRRGSDWTIQASDFATGVVGTVPHGVEVSPGTASEDLVRDADVAVVTGMTLTTDTLDGVLRAAAESGTALVVFAQTGSSFARTYCELGVDAVVAEPFPFYLSCAGPTNLHVHRARTQA